jgi:hypothetical protein
MVERCNRILVYLHRLLRITRRRHRGESTTRTVDDDFSDLRVVGSKVGRDVVSILWICMYC